MSLYDGQSVGEALDTLLREMTRARSAFDTDEAGGALAALSITGTFVDHLAKDARKRGALLPANLADPLLHLATALDALDRGKVDPMLRPNRSATRRIVDAAEDRVVGVKAGPPFRVLIGRATAAAAMDLCIKAGMKELDASRYVADRIRATSIMAEARAKQPYRLPKAWRAEVMAQAVNVGFGELPAEASDTRRAAAAFNNLVRVHDEVAVREDYTFKQRMADVDALLAGTSFLRPAEAKSEMP